MEAAETVCVWLRPQAVNTIDNSTGATMILKFFIVFVPSKEPPASGCFQHPEADLQVEARLVVSDARLKQRTLGVEQLEKADGALLIAEKGHAAQPFRLLQVVGAEDLQRLLGGLIPLPGFLDIGDALQLRLAEL